MSARTPTEAVTQTLEELAGIYGELYGEWVRATTRLLEVFDFRDVAGPLAALPAIPSLPSSGCGCEIPPACWLPVELGERTTGICPGQTATLRLRIVNASPSARTFTVASGTESDGLSIATSSLEVAPMEEETVTVTFTADPEGRSSGERRLLLWVRGCREHVLRWTIAIGDGASETCHHVDVEDAPDTVHHWYDHFYCAHACTGRRG